MRRLLAAALLAALGTACSPDDRSSGPPPSDSTLPTLPSGYPDKPILLKAPANPGGGWDQLARLVQQVLTEERIVPVPVEVVNRGGAGGTIALAELMTKNRGDPYAMMVTGRVMVGAILTNGSEARLDRTAPLARLTSSYEVIAVSADSPYRSLSDLVADFQKAPRTITWGGGSAGGTDHMLVGLLARASGVSMSEVNYVAYSGGGEALTSVLGKQVTAGIASYGEWQPQVEAKSLRFLAVSSEQRLFDDPTPTFKELGLPVTIANWRGIVAPPGVGEAERSWLIAALGRMRETRRWKQILKRNLWEDSFLAGDDFARFLQKENEATRALLQAIGLLKPSSS